MYNRESYLSAVKSQLEPNIVNHSLALEACMSGLYDYFQDGSDKSDWLLAGLIHDIDFAGEFKLDHPKKTREALAKFNLEISDVVDDIVKSHAPDLTGVKPQTKVQWSIFCAD